MTKNNPDIFKLWVITLLRTQLKLTILANKHCLHIKLIK